MKVRRSPPPDGDPPLRISPQISGYLALKVTIQGEKRIDPERGTERSDLGDIRPQPALPNSAQHPYSPIR
jgi:hypothetical protein